MKRFKNILFVADGAKKSCPAFERAMNLAEINNARLTVIDVIEDFETDEKLDERLGISLKKLLHDHRMNALAKMVEPYQSESQLIYTRVLEGIAFAEIIKTVILNKYDLLIKAVQPAANLSERILGSTDLHLLRKCPCPVWIDRPDKKTHYRQILAAVDPMSDINTAKNIMQLASSLALREEAKLDVVHAWRLPGESVLRNGRSRLSKVEVDLLYNKCMEKHASRLNTLLHPFDLSVDDTNVHLLNGPAAASILKLGNTADLIVMGTVGRIGIPGFFIGNTAEEVLQLTQASILAIKPEAYVSPLATNLTTGS